MSEPKQVIEIVVGPPQGEGVKMPLPETVVSARVGGSDPPDFGTDGLSAPDITGPACVCPRCGYRQPREAGQSCAPFLCPECGASLENGVGPTFETEIGPRGETKAAKKAENERETCEKCGEPLEIGQKCPTCDPEAQKEEKAAPEAEKGTEPEKGGMLEIVKSHVDGLLDGLKALFPSFGPAEQIASAMAQPAEGYVAGFKTFVGSDGKTWLLTWTTNAFEDREREIFSTKSLEDYVDRHAEDLIKGEYWFWHIPGSKFADILWQGVSGRFLVEAGPFDDTPVGEAFKAFFSTFPGGHQAVAPMGWGTSHGYVYRLPDRMDGVYEWFDKKETTVLPSHAAANAYTTMEVIEMALSKKQKAALAAIGGQELVTMVTEKGERMTKELEAAGVAFKGDTSDGEDALEVIPEGGFAGQIAQVAAQVANPDLAGKLNEIAVELYSGLKADKDEEADEDEEDEETEGETEQVPPKKKPPKSDEDEEEEEEDEKATWTTAYKNDLPDSAFLYIQPGGTKDSGGKTEPRTNRHLPYRNKDGSVDLPHLRNAISRLSQPDTGESAGAGDWLTESVRTKLLSEARAKLEGSSKNLNRIGVLATRLGGLADTLDGQKGMYLGAIADAMHQVAEAAPALAGSEKQTEPPETNPTAASEPGSLAPAMDMKAVVEMITDTLQLDSLSDALTALRGQVATQQTEIEGLKADKVELVARLAETEKTDERRLAEKDLGIPRFSWFRASHAAETVLDQQTAEAQKAAVQASRVVPGAIGALTRTMGASGEE